MQFFNKKSKAQTTVAATDKPKAEKPAPRVLTPERMKYLAERERERYVFQTKARYFGGWF